MTDSMDGPLPWSVLSVIDLSHNQLTSVGWFGDLPFLRHLDLSHNRLIALPGSIHKVTAARAPTSRL